MPVQKKPCGDVSVKEYSRAERNAQSAILAMPQMLGCGRCKARPLSIQFMHFPAYSMNDLSTLQSLGLELPSPAYIAGVIVFGIIGMAAYWRGKKTQARSTRWIGVALMLYPYVVSQTWLLYALGVALCAGLWLGGF